MNLPHEAVMKLNFGHDLAAELSTEEPMRSFVMVIPQVPNIHIHAEKWKQRLNAQPILRDPSSISGYEIRYVSHDRKYTETEWSWDYDHALEDETTRIKRLFVGDQADIAAALSPWITDLSTLRDVGDFDSTLLNSPLNAYLDDPSDLPHLWYGS